MLGAVIKVGDTAVTKLDKNTDPGGAFILVRETRNFINKVYGILDSNMC